MVIKHFEQLIRKQLGDTEHGFRIGWSIITQLLVFCDKLYSELRAQKEPLSVFLDAAKAFDIFKFRIFIHELSQYVFDEKFLLFFVDFLKVISGVPQGPNFAIFLFSFNINDFPDVFVIEKFLTCGRH